MLANNRGARQARHRGSYPKTAAVRSTLNQPPRTHLPSWYRCSRRPLPSSPARPLQFRHPVRLGTTRHSDYPLLASSPCAPPPTPKGGALASKPRWHIPTTRLARAVPGSSGCAGRSPLPTRRFAPSPELPPRLPSLAIPPRPGRDPGLLPSRPKRRAASRPSSRSRLLRSGGASLPFVGPVGPSAPCPPLPAGALASRSLEAEDKRRPSPELRFDTRTR